MKLFPLPLLFAVSLSLLGHLPVASRAATPYSANFLSPGTGLTKPVEPEARLKANADWTINFWMLPAGRIPDRTLLAGFGDLSDNRGTQRYLASFPDGLHFWGAKIDIPTRAALKPDVWQMLTAVRRGDSAPT